MFSFVFLYHVFTVFAYQFVFKPKYISLIIYIFVSIFEALWSSAPARPACCQTDLIPLWQKHLGLTSWANPGTLQPWPWQTSFRCKRGITHHWEKSLDPTLKYLYKWCHVVKIWASPTLRWVGRQHAVSNPNLQCRYQACLSCIWGSHVLLCGWVR